MWTVKGIDVSEFQGNIDWAKVKGFADFAIIRAGYGAGHYDKCCEANIRGCINNGIPIGLYWFSYATTQSEAIIEANHLCSVADKYREHITYPLCFDFEDDSVTKGNKKGVYFNKSLIVSIAQAFLYRIEERGYYATLYSNINFLKKGYYELIDRFDLWLAQWNVTSPAVTCGMWQYKSNGRVPGINGNVDLNIAFKEYGKTVQEEKNLERLFASYYPVYIEAAKEVIAGKYGNGAERKKAIQSLGLDYTIVQAMVNNLL